MSLSSPSQIAASDLNRILTSGYINGEENMGYMKRAGDHIASYTKSPHFHRPSKYSCDCFFFSFVLITKNILMSFNKNDDTYNVFRLNTS